MTRHPCEPAGWATQALPVTMQPLPEHSVQSPDIKQLYPHPARLILILSLAPTVGLGIGRFAYALVLPDMRNSLAWSYSAAGFMNTINAAGYLVGALLVSRVIRRYGLAAAARWGTLACVLSLALCALSGNFYILSFARLLAGVGAAGGFVGGGALAATIAQSRPERANFLLSLFLCRARHRHPGIGARRTLRAAGLRAGFVVDRVVGDDLARRRHDPSPVAGAAARRHRGHGCEPPPNSRFAGRNLSRRLLSVWRRLYRLHDLHDRLCAQLRRWSGGAERVLEPDRAQRLRHAVGVAARACARPRRPHHDHHPRRQRHRRCDADLRPFGLAVGAVGAGVRRRILRGGRLHHRLCPPELSASGLADRPSRR